MADISLETVAGKLNRVGYDAFLQSLRHARSEEYKRHCRASRMWQIAAMMISVSAKDWT